MLYATEMGQRNQELLFQENAIRKMIKDFTEGKDLPRASTFSDVACPSVCKHEAACTCQRLLLSPVSKDILFHSRWCKVLGETAAGLRLQPEDIISGSGSLMSSPVTGVLTSPSRGTGPLL